LILHLEAAAQRSVVVINAAHVLNWLKKFVIKRADY
jgi:hypothetical protein